MALITPTTTINHNGRSRSLRLGVGGVVAVAVVGAAGFVAGRPDKSVGDLSRLLTKRARRLRVPKFTLRLNDTMVDCISGGMGEVAAIVSLFPLDTLKVHCQARSITLVAALRHVLQQGPQSAIRSLYAGVGTAALGSAIVGAVHLSVYHYWKRLGHRMSEKKCSDDGGEPESCSTGPLAVFGAVMSSVTVGALEAPLDQIKLKRQANTIHGSPLHHLLETISSLGARHLFNSSFAPFVMKAIPHDVGEFVTFSALSENKSVQKTLSRFSDNGRDVILGATAGCAAAILSTPFDVICTKVQTSTVSSQSSKNSTMLNSFRAFGETARIELSRGGMKALYAGFVPRLLQMVPASVIYWAVVESTRRSLQHGRNVDVMVSVA